MYFTVPMSFFKAATTVENSNGVSDRTDRPIPMFAFWRYGDIAILTPPVVPAATAHRTFANGRPNPPPEAVLAKDT